MLPSDDAARQRLLHELDRTWFVEAGAGTGKTTLMVDRIVCLVATGRVSMEQLAAITFTEAAAAELRDRVREGLERAAVDDPRERTEAERARCRRAAQEIDLAALSTIHSFAGSLLRTYPLETGLPPGFGTLDEIEQGVAFDERWAAWLWTTALQEPARSVLRRTLLLGLSQKTLRELALALEEQHDLLTPATLWPAEAPPAALPVAQALGQELLQLESWAQSYARNSHQDALAQVVAGAQVSARRLADAASASEDAALAALVALGELSTGRGRQQDWGALPSRENACTATKAALKRINQQRAALLAAHRAAAFAGVLALLRDFVREGVRQRRAAGVATFQDLLAWARDLLRDHPDVRHRAQRQYRRLFVDELQDTDPLQVELAFYLAADESAGRPLPADWRDIPLVEGKLFVVGDPKQSIYRFRRADIAVYDALRQRLAHAQESLVQNFRSLRPVLEWVNHHFATYMTAAEGVQPRYVDLAASYEPFADGAPCGTYRLGGALADATADQAAAHEATALARLARVIVDKAWPVSDPRAPAGRRPARYQDVALLLRATTHLRLYERALEEAEVPFRVESGTLVLQTQEVRELLACLRAIDDPSDQVALVAALRSPAYACSDVDLLRWVEGHGRLDYEAPGTGPIGPVQAALASLSAFHEQRRALSPAALVEAFLADRLLVATALGGPRPRDAWRRLRYVAGRARAFTTSRAGTGTGTGTGRHTLRAFLDWIDGVQRASIRERESAAAETDEDALRILTIHRSKGLEFPVVLLGGLGAAGRAGNDPVRVIPQRTTGLLACQAGKDWETADFQDALVRENGMEDAERVRLLYVAATRARDHLVLSLFRGSRASGSHAAAIEERLASFAGTCQTLEPQERPVPDPAPVPDPPPPVAVTGAGLDAADSLSLDLSLSQAQEEAWLARRSALLGQGGTAPAWGTRPAADNAEEDEEDEDEDTDTARGRAVRQLVRRGWHTGSLPPEAATATDPTASARAQTILASSAVQRARQAARCWWDVPLTATVDGAVLDTVIDLVYQPARDGDGDGDGAVVLVQYGDALAGSASPSHQDAALLGRAFTVATGLRVAATETLTPSPLPQPANPSPLPGERGGERSEPG